MDEKIQSTMTKVVKEIVDSQDLSDKMFVQSLLEIERTKYETDQRKEEHSFQLQMMSMLFGSHSSQSAPGSVNAYGPPYQRFQL